MRKVKNLQKVPFPAPDVVTKVIPAPTEGWDAISPLASMDPKRAPILINWVPRPGWVELRSGYKPWAWVGSDSPVNTLMVYRSATAEKLFAAAGSSIFNVSTLSQKDEVVSSLTSSKWQYILFTPALGSTYLQCVNNSDSLRMYDGTSWTTPSITGLPGGLGTSAIVNIHSQKRRIWYALGDGSGGYSTIAAFMPTDAISGAIDGTLDLGALWTKGGGLLAINNWTVDGGSGPQDYICFISTRGQVSIFSGTDPTNAAAWSLVGTFDISPPISERCTKRIGSDIAIITQQGVVPISQALPFDPSSDRSVSITARIQNAMSASSTSSNGNFGWQLTTYPNEQLLILNIPNTENSEQEQNVMNTITGAWTKFTGWNANCFEIFNNDLYFGGNDGTVNWAYQGGLDLDQPITAEMQCAYNYFDDPGRTKRMTMVQPLFTSGGSVTPSIAVDEDFQTSSVSAPVQLITGNVLWDVAEWDVDDWPAETVSSKNWLSVQAIGHALAIHMKVNVTTHTDISQGEFDVSTFNSAQFDATLDNATPILQVNAFNAIMELGGFI